MNHSIEETPEPSDENDITEHSQQETSPAHSEEYDIVPTLQDTHAEEDIEGVTNNENSKDPQSEVDENEEKTYTPYIAKCRDRVRTLKRKKRDQESRMETVLQDTYGQLEEILYALSNKIQQTQQDSSEIFDQLSKEVDQSLEEHNRIELRLRSTVALLTSVAASSEVAYQD